MFEAGKTRARVAWVLHRILERLGFRLIRLHELEALREDLLLRKEELNALRSDRLALQEELAALKDRLLRNEELNALRSEVDTLRTDQRLLMDRVKELDDAKPADRPHGAVEVQMEPSTSEHLRVPGPYPFPSLEGVDPQTFHVSIVDVGAEALDFEGDVYEPLVAAGSCEIVGFDPLIDPAVAQADPSSTSEARLAPASVKRIFPYFIGDGRRKVFHVNRFTPTSSLFPVNLRLAESFLHLAEICKTVRTIDVDTVRLDDIKELARCDFLKVDVQGGDYDVVANATRLLERTLFVHIEAEFSPLYEGQPLFADIDTFMRSQDFELIDLVKLGWNNYRTLPSNVLRSRLLWADSIYMKDADRIAALDPLLLLRAAYIAHVNYRKYDLAAHLVERYDGISGTKHVSTYRNVFRAPGA